MLPNDQPIINRGREGGRATLCNNNEQHHWCKRTCSVVYSHAVSPVRASVSHDDRSAAKIEWERATNTHASVSSSARNASVGCDAHGFQWTRIGAKGQAATNRKRSTVQICSVRPMSASRHRDKRQGESVTRGGDGWGRTGRNNSGRGEREKGEAT